MSSDIAQEVFVKIWEKQVVYDLENIKSLLYKMAGNYFVDYIRKQAVANKYTGQIEFKMSSNNPDQELEYNELKERYEKGLTQLSEKQRSVFLMSRMEDLTYKEIAERLEISVKAVEKRMSVALSQLKMILH